MLDACGRLFVVLAVVFCAPVVRGADDEKRPGRAADEGLKLSFPDVKGWDRTPARPLPPDSGGYSVAYRSADGAAITLYVYNRNLPRVPDDLSSAAVKREMDGAKEAILELKRQGKYDEAKEEESGKSTLGEGGRPALYARYRLKVQEQEAVSEIFVLAHRNHFIKVRATRPADGPKVLPEAVAKLYAKISEVLVKPE